MNKENEANDENQVNVPLKSADEPETVPYEYPPPYEYPKIDFQSGWKDRGFAVAFWIHGIAVMAIAFAVGIPAFSKHLKQADFSQLKALPTNFDIKPYIFGLSFAIGIAGVASLATFLLLRLCVQHVVKFAFLFIIIMQAAMVVLFAFVFPPLCFIPGIFLFITLIFLTCIRKRISFAEAHLAAGCAALNSHPSLILVAILMLIVECLWFILWFFMALGVQEMVTGSTFLDGLNSNHSKFNFLGPSNFSTASTKLISTSTKSMFYRTTIDSATISSRTYQSITNNEDDSSSFISKVVGFFLLLSWFWGAIIFSNIAHFVAACAVGQWWFTDEANQQYQMGTSIRRAFTKNFGTICFGSLIEAFLKALRTMASKDRRRNIISCIVTCILEILEKMIGYLNEWAFIYAALTGSSFVQSGKSFFELFTKRGWTMIINDTLIGSTMGMINLVIGLISAVVGGLVVFFSLSNTSENIGGIIVVSFISFLIGILMSTIITTVLISCVRTVFVCFALNPAALGATHPEHLQRLTKVWYKFYPEEFSKSGYAAHLQEPIIA